MNAIPITSVTGDCNYAKLLRLSLWTKGIGLPKNRIKKIIPRNSISARNNGT
jgi:hypothetical protein